MPAIAISPEMYVDEALTIASKEHIGIDQLLGSDICEEIVYPPSEWMCEYIGVYMRTARRRHYYTLHDISVATGIEEEQIRRYESGAEFSRLADLISMSQTYGCSINELIGLTELTPVRDKVGEANG